MATAVVNKNHIVSPLGTLKLSGENFVVMKKEYLDELLILMRSVTVGERLLKEGKTRSFSVFLDFLSRRRK